MPSLLSKLINSKSSWHYSFTHPPVIVLFSFFPHPVYIFLSHLFSPFLGFFWCTKSSRMQMVDFVCCHRFKEQNTLKYTCLSLGYVDLMRFEKELAEWLFRRNWEDKQKSSALCTLSRGRRDFIDSPFSPPKSSSICQNALCFFLSKASTISMSVVLAQK